MMIYVLSPAGFLLLIKSTDFLVEGSSSAAKLLRVPTVIIGLTIMIFGTSMPKLAVSISASLSGSDDIAVGNVIGSNIFSLFMVVDACSVIIPVATDKVILYGDYLFSILAAAMMLALFVFDHALSRLDDVILLLLFAYFLYKMVRNTLAGQAADGPEGDDVEVLGSVKSVLFILDGLATIVADGNMVVNSASSIASSFDLSETLIGLTVTVLETPPPELAISVVASKKGESGLALGNVIRFSLSNILFVLAASTTISPARADVLSTYDVIFLTIASITTWFLAKSRFEVDRREGIIMVLMYVGYIAYIIMR